MIKFLDLSIPSALDKKISENINKVLKTNIFINGNFKNIFEKKFSDYVDAKYCIGVGNGLDALSIILKAYNIGPGDEVLVPAHTFIATWFSVSNVGAVPISVDVDPNSFNIDVSKIESKITNKTRAIILVHLYGNPANIKVAKQIAKQHNLFLFDDAAQAHGAVYKNRRIGSLTNASAWSFYPGKNLGAYGDAGAITTNNKKIYEMCKKISNYGSGKKYIHNYLGINSRMDEIQAAILLCKLPYLDKWNTKRKNQALCYIKNITNKKITLPKLDFFKDSVWHLFVIRVKSRDKFIRYMQKNNIECLIHYPKIPKFQDPYKGLSRNDNDYIFQSICNQIVSLPIGPFLNNTDQMQIINAVNNFK